MVADSCSSSNERIGDGKGKNAVAKQEDCTWRYVHSAEKPAAVGDTLHVEGYAAFLVLAVDTEPNGYDQTVYVSPPM